MRLLRSLCVVPLAMALLMTAALAVPGERDRLNACKALVERAGQPQPSGAPAPENVELQKCRQIIKEWTLRDSRMSVDENGQPMK